jgi:hypothetical protein
MYVTCIRHGNKRQYNIRQDFHDFEKMKSKSLESLKVQITRFHFDKKMIKIV